MEPQKLRSLAADLVVGLVGAISDVVLAVLIIAFLLVEAFSLPARLRKLAPFGAERW